MARSKALTWIATALILAGALLAPRWSADRSLVAEEPVWELCWLTGQGECKYKCTAPDPDQCPCTTSGECEPEQQT